METAMQQQPKKRSLGGLWARTTKEGRPYFCVSVKDGLPPGNYMIFENKNKKPGERAPDFEIYLPISTGQQQPAQVAQKPPPLNRNQGQGIKPPVAKTQWQNQRQEQMRPEKNWAEEPYPDEPQF